MSTGALDSTTMVPPNDTSGGGGGGTPGDGPSADAPPQGFWKTAVVDTFRNKRARVSVVWIALLAVCAVFAPFLANTHPLLMKQDGHWSSPAVRYLRPPDVMLIVVFAL